MARERRDSAHLTASMDELSATPVGRRMRTRRSGQKVIMREVQSMTQTGRTGLDPVCGMKVDLDHPKGGKLVY